MKTIFTFKTYRYVALTFVFAYLSLLVNGQTSTSVSVTNNKFTPAEVTINVGDKVVWTNTQGNHNVNGSMATFSTNPESFGNSLGTGWTYEYTFNTPGTYNYQCDPHAAMGMTGKVIVNPKAPDPLTLTVNFTGMTPHVGETLWISIIDQASKKEIGRAKKVISASFSISGAGIEVGKSYWVDFYADHNKNGVYDAPPVDHAWRMTLSNVTGNSVLDFAHNTTFTNILWKNKLTMHFTGFTPHIGQKLTLFLKQSGAAAYSDTVVVAAIPAAIFDVSSYKIKPGLSYNVDFYSDHNKNGVYNAPPTDHAWRVPLSSLKGDTIVNFAHNTVFTDILSTTSNAVLADNADHISLYPNPANDFVDVKIPHSFTGVRALKVYSITGSKIEEQNYPESADNLRLNLGSYRTGIYFLEINSGNRREVMKFLKE